MNTTDLLAALPIEIVAVTALLVMLADAFVKKSTQLCSTISIIGLIGGIVAAVYTLPQSLSGFNGLIAAGGTASMYSILFCAAGILTVFLAKDYLTRMGGMYNEFYTLLMMSIAGMLLMAHSSNFMTLFVGVEIMSICFYVLSGLLRHRIASNEAAIKYFLLGAFASGFLAYGMALIYGSVGSMDYSALQTGLSGADFPMLFWAGIGLLIVGMAFKVAAFPFHQWAPDVYEGAPTVVAGFMSTAGKAAAFSGFVAFMLPILSSGAEGVAKVQTVIAVLAVGSMFIGNITAIAQTNIKRMLAYSSVAHAGYLLVGIAAGNSLGTNGILYYLIAYLFMQIGAFAVVGLLEKENGGNLTFDDYKGLGRRKPGLAIIMAIFMFSLVGIPPFAGFFGKYYLFAAAIKADMTWLAICGVIASVISVWFYLGLVVSMFFREPEGEGTAFDTVSSVSKTALALAIAGTLIIGFIPELIFRALGQ